MKFTIISALLAISAAAVSADKPYAKGTLYVYANSIPHPKTTFLKKGDTNGSHVKLVTGGVACSGATTLPAKGHKGVLSAEFTLVNNTWGFNGAHDNEIRMGYLQLTGSKDCLSLTKGQPLIAAPCPSFTKEIQVGNKFAWFKDTRGSAFWAYGGDADAEEDNGLSVPPTHLQTTGKTLTGKKLVDSADNVFFSLGYVGLGDTGKEPTGCK